MEAIKAEGITWVFSVNDVQAIRTVRVSRHLSHAGFAGKNPYLLIWLVHCRACRASNLLALPGIQDNRNREIGGRLLEILGSWISGESYNTHKTMVALGQPDGNLLKSEHPISARQSYGYSALSSNRQETEALARCSSPSCLSLLA